jgi:competence protein ComEA
MVEPDSISESTDRSAPPGDGRWQTALAAWITWFGPARLITSAAAVLVVCAGLFWLVRTSPAPTEAGLTMATSIPTVAATAAPSVPSGPVSVHVAGAVERAGVYELGAGSRVQDAIAAAGGATPEADANALNLAAELVDGTRVYVPVAGETVQVDSAGAPATAASASGPVDLNRATAAELDVLPGVGPATAAAIVAEREQNGPFLSVDELARVRGIGPAKLDALAGLVTT